MKQKYSFFKQQIYLSAILGAVMFSCKSENTNQDYYRIISDFRLEKKTQFEYDFGRPIRMNVQKDIISFSNTPNFQVLRFNLNGKLIKTLGKVGKAPWENDAIWHFSLTKDGKRYWVHDYSKQLLKCYDYEKDTMILYRKIICEGNIQRLDNNRFIIPRTDYNANKYLFSIYDFNKNKYIKDFSISDSLGIKSNIVNGKNLCLFLLEGEFSDSDSRYILYFSHYVGRFYVYDKIGESIKIFKDIRNLQVPVIEVKNQTVNTGNLDIAVLYGCLDAKYVYLLTLKNKAKRLTSDNHYMLDIYNVENGKYIKSIEIPKLDDDATPRRIGKTKDRLIVYYNSQSIVTYNFNNSIIEKL